MANTVATEERKDGEFSFTLKFNDNIVVQRMFNIFGYNDKAKNSFDFKETVDFNVSLIKESIKNRSMDFMTRNSSTYQYDPKYDQNNSNDSYTFTVSHQGNELTARSFDATIYPVTVRKNVDVRDIIHTIIKNIQKTLSSKNGSLEYNYLNHKLV